MSAMENIIDFEAAVRERYRRIVVRIFERYQPPEKMPSYDDIERIVDWVLRDDEERQP